MGAIATKTEKKFLIVKSVVTPKRMRTRRLLEEQTISRRVIW